MSGSLVQFENPGLPGRVERQRRREVEIAKARGSVATANAAAKVEAVASVTETALICASNISTMEVLLVNRTPHAEARLRHIADSGTAGIGDVVLRMSREVQ